MSAKTAYNIRMPKGFGWSWLVALVVISGCGVKDKIETKIEEEDQKDDVETLIGQSDPNDPASMDFSGEMKTDLGREIQEIAQRSQQSDLEFVEQISDYEAIAVLAPAVLGTKETRGEYRTVVKQYIKDLDDYSVRTNDFWGEIYSITKKYDGDAAPDPNANMRIGFKAVIDEKRERAKIKVELLDFCDKANLVWKSGDMPDFKNSEDDKKFLGFVQRMSESESRVLSATTAFEQIRETQLEAARKAIGR